MNSTVVELFWSSWRARARSWPRARRPDQMDAMVTTRHAGRWTLADRFSSAWHYLPFEVSPGACAVRGELEYERSGAIMALGCMGAAGIRGGARASRRLYA